MPGHFEEDSYNVKEILERVLTETDFSSRYVWRFTLKIPIPT